MRGAPNVTFDDEEILDELMEHSALAGNWHEPSGAPEAAPYDWGTPASDIELEAHGFNVAALNAAIALAKPHVNSVLVIQGRELMKEVYFNGYDETISHHLMSATKSMLSATIGAAVADEFLTSGAINGHTNPLGLLDAILVEQELYDYTFCSQPPANITLLNLMTMTSGFTATNVSTANPTFGQMFVTTDWIDWIANGLGAPCSTWWTSANHNFFQYYGGNNHLGAEILRRKVAQPHPWYPSYENVYEFAVDRLFSRLGIEPTRWDHEPASNDLPKAQEEDIIYGPSQMFMRPGDLARVGQLYLDRGFDGVGASAETVLDPAWVDLTTQNLFAGPEFSPSSKRYGCWWYLEYFYGGMVGTTSDPGYIARGHGGQLMAVFPTLDLIVTTLSDWSVMEAEGNQQIVDNEEIIKGVFASMF